MLGVAACLLFLSASGARIDVDDESCPVDEKMHVFKYTLKALWDRKAGGGFWNFKRSSFQQRGQNGTQRGYLRKDSELHVTQEGVCCDKKLLHSIDEKDWIKRLQAKKPEFRNQFPDCLKNFGTFVSPSIVLTEDVIQVKGANKKKRHFGTSKSGKRLYSTKAFYGTLVRDDTPKDKDYVKGWLQEPMGWKFARTTSKSDIEFHACKEDSLIKLVQRIFEENQVQDPLKTANHVNKTGAGVQRYLTAEVLVVQLGDESWKGSEPCEGDVAPQDEGELELEDDDEIVVFEDAGEAEEGA